MAAIKDEIGVLAETPGQPQPISIRLPREGERCRYTDLPRGTLKDLVTPTRANNYKPPVRSISLRKSKYSKRGIRLIDYASLMEYLRGEFQKATTNERKTNGV